MNHLRKLLSFLIITALIVSSINIGQIASFAAEYYQYTSDNGNITSVSLTNLKTYVWSPYYNYGYNKPIIKLVVNGTSNLSTYSLDNVNWYKPAKGGGVTQFCFNIMEDYNDPLTSSDANTIIPKSINVVFIYVKEKNTGIIKVYQVKLNESQLNHLYSWNVPYDIINVTDKIETLPLAENLNTSDTAQVKAVNDAWAAYGLLNANQQSYVYNYWKLLALRNKVDLDITSKTDWNKVFPDLVNLPGKLTEQYYNVSAYKMYDPVFVNADKTKIYQTPLGSIRYNNASSSYNVMADTTDKSTKAFFEYDLFGNTKKTTDASPSMAKKVWGYFVPPVSGSYNFKVRSDDGHMFKMYMTNGTSVQSDIFNNLNSTSNVSTQFDLHGISDYYPASNLTLTGGVPYPIYIEYFNHGGDGALKLFYKYGTLDWTEMSGGVFKPSSSKTANTIQLIPTELKLKVDESKRLLDEYLTKTYPVGGTATDGYVSKAAYDALQLAYNDGLEKFNNAPLYTQDEINQATSTLQAAIDAFKKAVVTKVNLIGTYALSQQESKVKITFDRDPSVKGYRVILTGQDLDVSKKTEILAAGNAANGMVLDLTNDAFQAFNGTTIDFTFKGLPASLKKTDARPNGVFELTVDLNNSTLLSGAKLCSYAQTYKPVDTVSSTLVYSEYIKDTDLILKAPTSFNYYVDAATSTEGEIINFVAPNTTDIKYMLEYTDVNGKATWVYFPSTSNILSIPKAQLDATKIGTARLAVIEADGYGKPIVSVGRGPWLTVQSQLTPPKVTGVGIKYVNGSYTLNWAALTGAVSYDVLVGDSDDTSKMATLKTVSETSLPFSIEEIAGKYFSIKANFSTGLFKSSALSTPVHWQSLSSVTLKNFAEGTREITPQKLTYLVLTGAPSENGHYTITVPSNVKVQGYTTDASSGATKTLSVSYPEKAGTPDENIVVRSTPVVATTKENLDSKTTTYTFIPATPTANDYALIKKDFVIELNADKWYSSVAKPDVLNIVKYNVDAAFNLTGVSAPKTVNVSILPNEKEVTVNVQPMTPTGQPLKIVDGAAQVTLGKQALKYHFEFTKGDAYKPIIEFAFNESPYVEISTYNFTFKTGAVGSTGTVQTGVEYVVRKDPTNPNRRIVKVYFNQAESYKDRFIDISVNYEPEVKDISSDAQMYNTLTNTYVTLKNFEVDTYTNLSALLKPGVTVTKGVTPALTDYLLAGLSIETFCHYDDTANSGLTGDNRMINEVSDTLKIKIIDKVVIKKAY